MKWAQKVKIIRQAEKRGRYPLPDGKPEKRNVFGKMKRWNTTTGKYDLPA